tara:strand:+ start:119 stop:670 length:552 start_codon:yes stop_codon:yes gene_type:complete
MSLTCTRPQFPNTQCHGHLNNLTKFTDNMIKRMLVGDWASAAPEQDVLDARFVNMEVSSMVLVRAFARARLTVIVCLPVQVYATEKLGARLENTHPAFLCAVHVRFSDTGSCCFSLDVRWADEKPFHVDHQERYGRQMLLRVEAAGNGGSQAFRNAKFVQAEQWAKGHALSARMLWHCRAFRP